VEADEIDSERTKFFECIDQLAQATSKPVVAVDNNGVHQPFPAGDQEPVQCRTVFFGAAHPGIRVLASDLPTPSLAVGSEFLKLHLRILADWMTASAPSTE